MSAPISLPLSGNPDIEGALDQYSRSARPVEAQEDCHENRQEEQGYPDPLDDLNKKVFSHRQRVAW